MKPIQLDGAAGGGQMLRTALSRGAEVLTGAGVSSIRASLAVSGVTSLAPGPGTKSRALGAAGARLIHPNPGFCEGLYTKPME